MSELPEGIRQESRYIVGRDGSTWESLSAAGYHLAKHLQCDAANLILQSGGTVWEALRAYGLGTINGVFHSMTRQTKLTISHWQCRDEPGYCVACFDPIKGIYVFGDAGSWSGPYGSYVSYADLERYAIATLQNASAA